jgi:hypothetical protein
MRGELRDFEWAAMTGCRQYLAFIKFASIRIWLRARHVLIRQPAA